MEKILTREDAEKLMEEQGEHIKIPEGYTKFDREAFRFDANIKSIEFPNTMTSIDYLLGCKNIESVKIPESITKIVPDAFNNIKCFAAIYVDENNKAYSSVDGVLFNKEMTAILKYPTGKEEKEYTVPASV